MSDQIDLEFAYGTWQDSCRNIYSLDRCCRRFRNHDGDHASGFGNNRITWPRQVDELPGLVLG